MSVRKFLASLTWHKTMFDLSSFDSSYNPNDFNPRFWAQDNEEK